MNKCDQAPWQPESHKKQWIIAFIIIASIVGLYALLYSQDVHNPEKFMSDVTEKTIQVVGFAPSEERTAYLEYVADTMSQDDEVSRWQASEINDYFYEAKEMENRRTQAAAKNRLAKTANDAL